jgi:hypothetical protein
MKKQENTQHKQTDATKIKLPAVEAGAEIAEDGGACPTLIMKKGT